MHEVPITTHTHDRFKSAGKEKKGIEKQNKTKQNKTKQYKTKQNKTKQNKTKQDKTKQKQKQKQNKTKPTHRRDPRPKTRGQQEGQHFFQQEMVCPTGSSLAEKTTAVVDSSFYCCRPINWQGGCRSALVLCCTRRATHVRRLSLESDHRFFDHPIPPSVGIPPHYRISTFIRRFSTKLTLRRNILLLRWAPANFFFHPFRAPKPLPTLVPSKLSPQRIAFPSFVFLRNRWLRWAPANFFFHPFISSPETPPNTNSK